MAELVREDAEAAVLGLDGVVADPDAGVTDLGAAEVLLPPTTGPVMPKSVELTYQRCDQMASSPWAPPPASSPSPAWTAWKWSR